MTCIFNEYFTKFPEDAGEVVLYAKAGRDVNRLHFDGSETGLRRPIEDCVRLLDGKKNIDVFECARVNPNTPIEMTVSVLAKFVRLGMIQGIGLSEVRTDTMNRRASRIHPVAQVEVELSLWSTNILHNGVTATCAKLGIPIIAFSPLNRGALTKSLLKHHDTLPDQLKIIPR